jgi:hypothetical protein
MFFTNSTEELALNGVGRSEVNEQTNKIANTALSDTAYRVY